MADLEDVTVHDLRRTHRTHAAVAGVDLQTLAGRLGRADLSIPRQHYDASVGSAVVEAAEIISQKFSGMMENIGD